ncbi:YveK family protein [Mogibacterium pumilum]|uniref:Polysaccharide chain length determinant N-terminal domain-containing protein n=1 Tax=Mogibacterium pumilum TaxID=86332 RepID=A0A223AQV0_9FIRM|nr:hypothetical protein [Mogibacterium pumilum]ASS37348.1 hypothetical protein AXF17_01935 [Mogibacterium pumilum]
MENSFEKRIIELVKKYAVVMIICMAVCAVVMAKVEGSKASTSYKAKLTVAVTPVDGYQNSTLDDIKKNEELVGLYAKISTSSKTLDRVAEYAGLDENGRIALNSRVAVDIAKEGQFVDIYITADTEDEALKLADAEAKAFVEVGKEVRGEDMLKVISMPKKPLEVESVSKKGYYATGGVAGIFVGIIVSALLEMRRKKLTK